MKRIIKNSTSCQSIKAARSRTTKSTANKYHVTSVDFVNMIARYVDDELDKAGSDIELEVNPQYTEIDLHYCQWGQSAIMSMVAEILDANGWDLYQNRRYMRSTDYVAINRNNESFVNISIKDYGTDTYIFFDFPNSNPFFEDWYDSYIQNK